jgi:Dolichyl-phosphate-mannose-protein mannosyltransferase
MKSLLRSFLRSAMLACIVAFALRMALLWVEQRHLPAHREFRGLGLEEARVAWSLANGRGFFSPFPGYDTFTAWLAPVYPVLWSILIRLSRLNEDALIPIGLAMNCVFSAATCWPIFSIAKKLFGEKIGLASAWTWALLPYAILMPLEWTWDQSLSALVLAWIVDVTLRLRESASPLAWTGYGLLWGFTALVNPTLCGLLPFLLGWLVWQRWRVGIVSPALYARVPLLFVLAVLPWTIRNYYVIDGWFFVKSNFGLELWLGNHPASAIHAYHPAYSHSERFSLILSGEPNYNKARQRAAMAYIKSDPLAFAKRFSSRVVDTWSAREDSWVDGWIVALHLSRVNIWFCSLFSVISFAGLLLALHANWEDSLLLGMCLVMFPIPYYITHTGLRYRHPIDPLLTIFAVYAIARLRRPPTARPAIETLEPAVPVEVAD